MNNPIKLIAGMVLLMASFLAMPEVQAQSNAEKLPGLMEKNGSYLFTALKMSPADQTALLNLLNKENSEAYNVSVNTARNDQSYGRLTGVPLKMKEIAGNKITSQASTTCHTVSTDNNCNYINTIVTLKGLSAAAQTQVKSLLGKYLN
jgi:CRISPR/Cas system CMR-associated protein Cmr5 small subunit